MIMVMDIIKKPLRKVRYMMIPRVDKMSLKKREKSLKKLWKTRMNTELELRNPKSFTQILQWMKLYYKHQDLARCVDKCEFKKYIKEKIGDGYTAKMLREWSSPNEIDFEGLPEKFVIKSNCQSDGNYIIVVKDKSRINEKEIKREIKKDWFNPRNLLINSYCRAYYDVKPKVLVEEYLEQFENQLNDYKIFCFNGEPKFFYVASEHFDSDGRNGSDYPISFFSLDWKHMDIRYGNHEQNINAAKPKHIEEMIQLSKTLSSGFPFVRVDFFDTDEKLYLAELTFYPGGGWTNYYPQSFDEEMGRMIDKQTLMGVAGNEQKDGRSSYKS